MIKDLKKRYFMLLSPALLGFFLTGTAKGAGWIFPCPFGRSLLFSKLLFVLAALTAMAGPVLVRTVFAHGVRNNKQVDPEVFLKFEMRLLYIVLTTPWFALAAYGCDFEKFYTAGIVLMALYAAYYYYPSEKRINFDKRIFRVK